MPDDNNWKYYPNPTFTSINDEGEIVLEWCKTNGRLLIVFDSSGLNQELESNTYAILTLEPENGKTEFTQELIVIKNPEDVVTALRKFGMEPE